MDRALARRREAPRASLERELERRGEARVARNARAWHEALAPVNEAAIAAVERRLASPSSALALVASNVPWAFDGLARREWLNALDELVGAEEARAASNASFARDLRARPRNSAALRAMTRRSSRRVAAVFAREDEAMRRKRAEVRARFRWRVAAAACACPPLARLASILRQKKKKAADGGPGRGRRNGRKEAFLLLLLLLLPGRRRRRGSRVVRPGRRGFERASTRSYSPRRSPFRRARATKTPRTKTPTRTGARERVSSLGSLFVRARATRREDRRRRDRSGETVSGRRRRGGSGHARCTGGSHPNRIFTVITSTRESFRARPCRLPPRLLYPEKAQPIGSIASPPPASAPAVSIYATVKEDQVCLRSRSWPLNQRLSPDWSFMV